MQILDYFTLEQHMHYGAIGLLKHLQSGRPLLYSKCKPLNELFQPYLEVLPDLSVKDVQELENGAQMRDREIDGVEVPDDLEMLERQ